MHRMQGKKEKAAISVTRKADKTGKRRYRCSGKTVSMPELNWNERKLAERNPGYGQPFWICRRPDSDCRGKCLSADSLRGDSDVRRFSDDMHPSASGGGCAVIHGRIASWRAGSLRSGNACQPGRALAELLESRPMKFLGVSGRGCLEDDCLVSEKRAAGCAARPMHSDHPKSHLGSGRHGGDEDAGISAIYHQSEVRSGIFFWLASVQRSALAWEQAAEYVKLYADVVFLILMVGTVCFPAFHLYRKKHQSKISRMHEIMHDMQKICLQFSNKCAKIHLNK